MAGYRRYAVASTILLIAAMYVVAARRLPVGVLNDDAANVLLAQSMRQGRYAFPGGLGDPQQFLPAFPALLLVPVLLVEPHWELLRAIPLAFAALAMFLAWRLARRFLSAEAAAAAVLLASLNPVVLGLSGMLLPYMPYLALSLALIDGAGAAPTRRSFALLTLGAAVAPLLRPHGAVLIAALALGLWHKHGLRRAGAFLSLACLPFAALTAYNRLGAVASQDYVGVWRENIATLAGPAALFARFSDVLLNIFAQAFLNIPELPRTVQLILTAAMLAVALAGAFRLLKGQEALRSFVLAAYVAGLFFLHMSWRWPNNRYVIPFVPLLWILLITATAPLLRKRRVLAGALLTAFVVIALRRDVQYALRGLDGDARFEPETMSWIKDNIPASARIESMKDYTVPLLTGRLCYAQSRVRRAGDWLLVAEYNKIEYLHLQFRRPGDEFSVSDAPDDYQPLFARWLGSRTEVKEVYRNLDEGALVYRVDLSKLHAVTKQHRIQAVYE